MLSLYLSFSMCNWDGPTYKDIVPFPVHHNYTSWTSLPLPAFRHSYSEKNATLTPCWMTLVLMNGLCHGVQVHAVATSWSRPKSMVVKSVARILGMSVCAWSEIHQHACFQYNYNYKRWTKQNGMLIACVIIESVCGGTFLKGCARVDVTQRTACTKSGLAADCRLPL